MRFRTPAIFAALGLAAVLSTGCESAAPGVAGQDTQAALRVAAVRVTPSAQALQVGTATQLAATTVDSAGRSVAGVTVSWASSSTTIATVNATGLVQAKAEGSAIITATGAGKSGTAALTVSATATGPVCAPTGAGACYYVATTGNDANPGTSAQPFRTPQRAVSVVNPGDIVIVRDGIYTGGSGPILSITRGGTSSNLVVFKAEHQWGAILDGQSNTSSTAVQYAANYIRVDGFDIRNVNHYGIDMGVGLTGLVAARNNVHDVGHYCTATTSGLSGFAVDDDNSVIEQNVIHDIGRYAAGENGCSPGNAYYQNHDHGIYLSSGTNVIIRNNVFYNINRGWAVHRYNVGGAAADQLYIVNNTFAFPNPYRDGQIIINCPMTNSVIANNIFYQPTTAGIWFDAGGPMSNVTVSNNVTYGGVISTGSTTGATLTNNMNQTDPRLTNPSALDFRLQAGSPAIGAGVSLSYVWNDFAGLTRAANDVGAYTF